MQRKLMTFALALSILNAAGPAHAYIGPGAGLGAIALTIALAVGVVLPVVLFADEKVADLAVDVVVSIIMVGLFKLLAYSYCSIL